MKLTLSPIKSIPITNLKSCWINSSKCGLAVNCDNIIFKSGESYLLSVPEWHAIPAAELAVPDLDSQLEGNYVPPVNYRLQTFIEERAGNKPQATWFERQEPAKDDFPSCLIRDEWEDPECPLLCDLYLQRLTPRLLMIDGLPATVRQRLEQAACDYVFDVEKFYPLYPEVVDNSLLNNARIEARMRRANQA